MIDILILALPCIVIAALYFMGRNFAGLQLKKHASFKSAFGRSAILISLLTVLVFIPIAIAGYLSVSQFPHAIEQAFLSTSFYMEQLIQGISSLFSLIAIPFMVGLWVKYRALPEPVTA